MINKLLPIGSVVTLNRISKKVMIIGRFQKSNNKIFDYAGCLYPEGYLQPDKSIVFNNSDIDIIYFIGMQDLDEFEFNKKLQDAMKKTNDDKE